MNKYRFDKLGIEIEAKSEANFDIKESKNCIRIFYENKKIATILPDSKIEFRSLGHIIGYKGRIVVFGGAYVEAWGMRVFAKDKVCVEACQGSEIRAGGRTKVRALDSARVIAGGRAQVDLEGKSIGYKKTGSRVKMNKLDNRAAVFDLS